MRHACKVNFSSFLCKDRWITKVLFLKHISRKIIENRISADFFKKKKLTFRIKNVFAKQYSVDFTGTIFLLCEKIHNYMNLKTIYWQDSTTFLLPSDPSNCHEDNLARPVCTYKKSTSHTRPELSHNTMSLLSKTRRKEQSKKCIISSNLQQFYPECYPKCCNVHR